MRATAWRGGSTKKPIYGIRVGKANRNQFFEPDWTQIVVEIDGGQYQFNLTPGFWNQCPEFRDSGSCHIKDWIDRHFTINWPKGKPPSFQLIPLGGNRFQVSK